MCEELSFGGSPFSPLQKCYSEFGIMLIESQIATVPASGWPGPLSALFFLAEVLN